MSDFTLVRQSQTNDPMTGQLQYGDQILYTLELPWKDNLPGVSCIPAGKYPVVIAFSNRFQRLMPRLIGVPGRDGILIHSGNVKGDTEGCILVGKERTDTGVGYSRLAFGQFFQWLGIAMRDGDVNVEISYA